MNLKTLLDDLLLKPLHMDNQEQQPTMETEEVQETNEQIAEAFNEPETHSEKDPSFNCTDCRGEGLLVNGNLCPTCKGTGKV